MKKKKTKTTVERLALFLKDHPHTRSLLMRHRDRAGGYLAIYPYPVDYAPSLPVFHIPLTELFFKEIQSHLNQGSDSSHDSK